MRKACVVIVILLLALGGYACGRSNEKSKVESKAKKEVQSLEQKASEEEKTVEKKAVGEVKNLEKDLKVFEEEKAVEKKMGKEIEKIPPPEEDWGHEADNPRID